MPAIMLEKMDLYRSSGIYPGKNLIFTYETEDNLLDIKDMRKRECYDFELALANKVNEEE